MRQFLRAIIIVCYITANHHCNPTRITSVHAVEVSFTEPVMGSDTYRIYYWKKLIMYETHYRFDSVIHHMHQDASQIQSGKEDTVITERRINYFVFDRDSSFGYNFDPTNERVNNLKLPVDSISKIRTLQSTNLDTAASLKPDTVSWNADKTELREVFRFPAQGDLPSFRWALHYSKKLNHLVVSFSPLLDSVKQLKLYKIDGFIDSFFVKNENKMWPAMLVTTEIKEIKVQNPQKILAYFFQYEKLIQ